MPRIGILAIYVLSLSALGTLLWILGSIVANGLPIVMKYGYQLFVNDIPPPIFFFGTPKVGIAPAIVGTLEMIFMALLISFPIGFLAGVLIAEFRRSKLSRIAEDVASLLVELPTIAAGIAIYWLVVVPTKSFSALAGSMALSVIMVPYITIYTAEAYRKVPKEVKEGGLALGIPYPKVLFKVLRGLIAPGVVTGTLIALAKAAGEAAPLLFTAGWSDKLELDPLKPSASLSVLIYKFGFSSQELWLELSWAASFVLVFAIILPLIIISKLVVRRHEF
ncbi:phosphate ABC transporter permease [Ignicoccus islandicus DSM 13165]|uniref:Phosphate ABC transporter permease n=1 Tax=Ignicoccus islandicus DSM 13165 TaxID=940295 RepID=A0A0U3F1U5_9CREN|nr:ABC transporter permease subunit [Ignicoccus islandicus]ALU11525.1 phosphate ABC transporter permease [Ignicoccus islandicus DSM 13165]